MMRALVRLNHWLFAVLCVVLAACSTPPVVPTATPTSALPTSPVASATPPPNAPTVTPSPTPAAPLGPLEVDWEKLADGPQQIVEVARSGLLGIGSDVVAIFRRHAWRFSDRAWSQVFLPGKSAQVESLDQGPPILAAGCTECHYYGIGDGETVRGAETRGVIWLSDDGEEWDSVDLGSGTYLTSVESGQAGYAALGFACAPGSVVERKGVSQCDWEQSVWTSPNAESWTKFKLPVLAGGDYINSLVVADRTVVALGSSDSSGPVAWTIDETTVSREAFDLGGDPTTSEVRLVGASALGSRLIGVGFIWHRGDEWSTQAAWHLDGSKWLASSAQPHFALGQLDDVDLVGDRLIAVGTHNVFTEQATAWTSRDGLVWNELQVPPTSDVYVAVTAIDRDTVLVGTRGGAFWRASLEALP